jgi:DNA-binding MarR family transcriptional regulator
MSTGLNESCATTLMEVAPALMHRIRHEMRRRRPGDVSLPQFQALAVLNRHPDASMSELAAHLRLTLASASKLVDVLERGGLATRRPHATDRRKVALLLTEQGSATLALARDAARDRLAALLDALPEDELAGILRAGEVLRDVLNAAAICKGVG